MIRTSSSKPDRSPVLTPSVPPLLPLLLLPLVWCAAACDGDGTTAPRLNAAAPTGLAIVSSDYSVSSLALYDPASGAVRDDCLYTDTAGSRPSISGDTALPSQPQLGGELVVIDRKDGVLSFVRPADCQVRVQISVATAFKANPRDVVRLSPSKAYVTRYETNLDPTPDPGDFDEGNDVLIVDPAVTDPGRAILGRIPLAAYASTATVQARPDRAVLADGRVYVSLGNLDDMFAGGPGRIVIIDPERDQVVDMIELPEQTDCSGLEYVAATKRLYVACGDAFDSPAPTSALVEIDLGGAQPSILRTIAAPAVGGGTQPINFGYVAATGDLAFFGLVGTRDFNTNATLVSDGFYSVPHASGSAVTKLVDGGGFSLGRPAIDGAGAQLLLPDGDDAAPKVHRFRIAGGAVTADGAINANPAGGLPPREVARY
jgi:hypothetical protein